MTRCIEIIFVVLPCLKNWLRNNSDCCVNIVYTKRPPHLWVDTYTFWSSRPSSTIVLISIILWITICCIVIPTLIRQKCFTWQNQFYIRFGQIINRLLRGMYFLFFLICMWIQAKGGISDSFLMMEYSSFSLCILRQRDFYYFLMRILSHIFECSHQLRIALLTRIISLCRKRKDIIRQSALANP